MSKRIVGAVAVLSLVVAATPAHDYWLQPETFFPSAGKEVVVRLHVGDGFRSEAERPFQKKPTLKFQLLSAKETVDLTAAGEDGKTPVARITPKTPGNYLIALERAPATITLAADKFNKYLAEEGLEAVLEQRRKSGEDKQPGRERYSRYIKCLLQVGERHDATCTKALGLKLEIVPEVNPYALKPGDSLPVRVLFEGKPVAGARLFAHRRAGDKLTTQMLTTTREGRATVKLDAAGDWLVRLVVMRRYKGEADVDWESFWGACTFGVK